MYTGSFFFTHLISAYLLHTPVYPTSTLAYLQLHAFLYVTPFVPQTGLYDVQSSDNVPNDKIKKETNLNITKKTIYFGIFDLIFLFIK